MIIGWIPKKTNKAWASFYGYRGFRGAAFYGEQPKPNTTYFCAESSNTCPECLSCCSAQFPNQPNRRAGCERRCRRKFPAGQCSGSSGGCGNGCPDGYVCQNGQCVPVPPQGAEQCPVVCVPDGTGITCNYNCMGLTRQIINTGTPGQVIPVSYVKSWYNSNLAPGTSLISPTSTVVSTGGGGDLLGSIVDTGSSTVTSIVSNLPILLLLGGGGYLAYKLIKK